MEQSNLETTVPTPPTPEPEKKSSTLTIILAIILTALIAGFLAYYFTQKYYSENTDTSSSTENEEANQGNLSTVESEEKDKPETTSSSEDSTTILLSKIDRTGGIADNPNELKLHITSHQFPGGEEEELAVLTSNFHSYNSVFYYKNKFYYTTLEGQLGAYSLSTGKTEIINIPGVDNSNDGYLKPFSISDFALDEGKILYLKGTCTEREKCTVGLYNLATKENQIIVEDFMAEIEPVFLNVVRLESFDAGGGRAVITDNGGDAGYGTSVYYELNTNTSQISNTDKLEFYACGDDPEMMMGPCDPEQEAKNKHHEEVQTQKYTMCGEVKVKTDEYWRIVIEGDNEVEEVEDASFVACQ